MNTASNAVPEYPVGSQASAPAAMSTARVFCWSVRRELWEHRSIYVAPLAVAALILAGFFISTVHLADRMRASLALGPMQQTEAIQQPYTFAALLMMASFFIVALFYSLDALYGERRDRSILFWKSMPVSDLMTVLAKASVPILILPLLTFTLTITTQGIMALLSTVVLRANGLSAATLWSHLPLPQMSLMLLDHLVGVHGLWYAPIYCWLLLVSAWARRAPFLWAVLPLFAMGIVERIAFNTAYLSALLQYRLLGGPEGMAFDAGSMSTDPLANLNPVHFLLSPGMWIGFVFAAVFLFAASRIRRSRGPM